MFRFFLQSTRTVAIGALVLVFGASTVLAAFTAPGVVGDINANIIGQADVLAVDPNATGPNFSGASSNVFLDSGTGAYSFDDNGAYLGNDILVMTQSGLSNNSGAGFSISISNGENGDGLGSDPNAHSSAYGYWAREPIMINGSDPSNTVAADPVFTDIGNSSGRLEDGNVIRFSVWVRQDAFSPQTVESNVPPIVKLEFWRDALSGNADFDPGQTNPDDGSRIFDTDQNDSALIDPADKKRTLDIDGIAGQTEPQVGQAWQQIVHTYEVDSKGTIKPGNVAWDVDPFGGNTSFVDGQDSAIVEDVTFVEEIRGVMFVGDFTGNPGDDLGDGSLWWDNALIEVFKDTTAEAAVGVLVSNPSPALEELAGDFDSDGDVDGFDFLVWQRGETAEGGSPAELADWETNYGTVLPLSGVLSSVPEPSTALLVLIGVLCLKRTGRHSPCRL